MIDFLNIRLLLRCHCEKFTRLVNQPNHFTLRDNFTFRLLRCDGKDTLKKRKGLYLIIQYRRHLVFTFALSPLPDGSQFWLDVESLQLLEDLIRVNQVRFGSY